MSDIVERFFAKVKLPDNTNECWEWTGSATKDGRGQIYHNGKLQVASRVSYAIHIGEVPNDLYVCHTCDNPKCVNPKHLWLGSARDNHKDGVSKGRIVQSVPQKVCSAGHKKERSGECLECKKNRDGKRNYVAERNASKDRKNAERNALVDRIKVLEAERDSWKREALAARPFIDMGCIEAWQPDGFNPGIPTHIAYKAARAANGEVGQ